jgi:hypothetical protein
MPVFSLRYPGFRFTGKLHDPTSIIIGHARYPYTMETKYLILLTAVIAVIGVYGVISMQLLVAVIAIAVILAILLIVRFFEKYPSGARPESEGEAIVAAALIALVGTMVSQWIVWAAILGVILISQQSLARIEKRLDALEKR